MFGFTGHEKDSETGLYYFKARYYDPDTARFLNQDSYLGDVGTPPSLHRYLYAYSNPGVYVDLDGHTATGARAARYVGNARKWLRDYEDEYYSGDSAGDWVGTGFLRVGQGFFGAVSGLMNVVDHGVNLTSTGVGKVFDNSLSKAHAQEVTATNKMANKVVDYLAYEGGAGEVGDKAISTVRGMLAGKKQSYADATEFGIGMLGGGNFAKARVLVPAEKAIVNLSKNVAKTTAVIVKEAAGKVGETLRNGVLSAKLRMSTVNPNLVSQARGNGSVVGRVETFESVLGKQYAGVKEASKFLQNSGVPREFRKQILDSFDTKNIKVRSATNAEFGMRYFDNVNAWEKGRYLFETFPASRQSLALKPEWNQMTHLKQFQVRPNTTLLEGPASSMGIGVEGGQIQKYILNLDDLLELK